MSVTLRSSWTALATIFVVLLPMVSTSAMGQIAAHGASAAQPSPQASAVSVDLARSAATSSPGAGAATAVPSAAIASAAASASPNCETCPQPANVEQVLQRIEAAASATQAAASAAAGNSESVWKSVFLNVFSNRLDSFLFGSGEAGRGLIPILVGVLSLLAAGVKLLLAYSARKRRAPRSDFTKAVDLWLAGYLVFAAAVALWALLAAKSSADAVTAPTEALTTALSSCTAELRSARIIPVDTPSPDRQVTAALQGIREACVATTAAQASELSAISKSAKSIAGDQHGFLFNLLVVASAFGVFALLYKALFAERE